MWHNALECLPSDLPFFSKDHLFIFLTHLWPWNNITVKTKQKDDNDNAHPGKGYNHVKFERSHFNSVWEKNSINTHNCCNFYQLLVKVCSVKRQMYCNTKLKTLNNSKTKAKFWNHRKSCVCSDPCICTTQECSFLMFDKTSNIFYNTKEKAITFFYHILRITWHFPADWI